MGQALTKALQEPESRELLLLRRIIGDNTPFTPDTNDLVNAIKGAISGQLDNIIYNNEFQGMGGEYDWCHAKLTNGLYPDFNISLSGYDLTHNIMYASDFGRIQKYSNDIIDKLLLLIPLETDPDLLVEYIIALKYLGFTLLSEHINIVQTIFNNFDLDNGDKHLLFLLAISEYYGII